jgi:hypothetical protein
LVDLPRPGPPSIDQLIKQLGSEEFAEREAAAEALETIGAPALEALRNAARNDDPEVRRRAERLITVLENRFTIEVARSIRESNLSPVEKGRKLAPLIKPGMTGDQVRQLLGSEEFGLLSRTTWTSSIYYDRYALRIDLKVNSETHEEMVSGVEGRDLQ